MAIASNADVVAASNAPSLATAESATWACHDVVNASRRSCTTGCLEEVDAKNQSRPCTVSCDQHIVSLEITMAAAVQLLESSPE
jgi:hypothetical protein